MATQPKEIEITFHADGMDEARPSINIKCHNWPDLGDDLTEIDQQCIWERVQEDWHGRAASVAHSYGYSGCFTGAVVFGQHLDNAFGDHLDPSEPEHQSEIVIVLTENGNPYCVRNLATVLSEAAAYRRAVQSGKLAPGNVDGPSL